MGVLAHRFLTEPVFALGVLSGTAAVLAAEGIISAVVGAIAVGVITVVQRQLVKPAKV